MAVSIGVGRASGTLDPATQPQRPASARSLAAVRHGRAASLRFRKVGDGPNIFMQQPEVAELVFPAVRVYAAHNKGVLPVRVTRQLYMRRVASPFPVLEPERPFHVAPP